MSQPHQKYEFLGVPAVFGSDAMRRVLEMVQKVATSNAAILITGESGCGKEVVARAIHHFSTRKARSWIDLNCAAIPDNLLESELFGHEKGAFSGAETAKQGLFELADQGTLFLDEIGDLDPRLQVKLLRVLDGAAYYRLGGVKKVSVNVRLVTATNQNLASAIENGRFRGDLYHRLSQIRIHVPPLRQRKDDIVPLANHYLSMERPECRFSTGALHKLREHSWPGNVRELRNVVVRAAILTESVEIREADLPEEFQHDDFVSSLASLSNLGSSLSRQADAAWSADRDAVNPDTQEDGAARLVLRESTTYLGSSNAATQGSASTGLNGLKRNAILRVLELEGGHRQKAADRLGISKRTLQRRLKEYGVGTELLATSVPQV